MKRKRKNYVSNKACEIKRTQMNVKANEVSDLQSVES